MNSWRLPLRKAREINVGNKALGAFAEIGAGQEVARIFFFAGKASNTVAKTMSAYAKEVSDDVYLENLDDDAPSIPYTARFRLMAMLEREHGKMMKRFLINERNNQRLVAERGEFPCLFTFANTMSTGEAPYGGRSSHQGWLGVRVQNTDSVFTGARHERGRHIDLLAHVVLLEQSKEGQCETVGMLGVNMIYASLEFLSIRPRLEDQSRLLDAALAERVFDGVSKWKAKLDVLEVNPTDSVRKVAGSYYGTNRSRSFTIAAQGLTNEALISDSKPNVPPHLFAISSTSKSLGGARNRDYDAFRERLDNWFGRNPTAVQSGAHVDQWAYAHGGVREPFRLFMKKHVLLFMADLVRSDSMSAPITIEACKPTREVLISLTGKDREEVFLPLAAIHVQGFREAAGAANILDAWEGALKGFDKSRPKNWSVVLTRFSDLGAIVESLRRSMDREQLYTLVLDLDRWRALVADSGHRERIDKTNATLQDLKKRIRGLKGSEESQLKELENQASELEVIRDKFSVNALDCLQRIQRAGCKLLVSCDEAEELMLGVLEIDSYIEHLLAAQVLEIRPPS